MSDQVDINNQSIIDDDMNQSIMVVTSESDNYTQKNQELEKDSDKSKQLNEQRPPHHTLTDAQRQDIDSRSIYVGQVDYNSTPLELQQHFSSAGIVNRVTILLDKFSGKPKGFAYIEFETPDAVDNAVATLDGSTFRDRELKVNAKRTNIPGVTRGRGALRSRGRGRGGFRSRGRSGFRGRGSRFSPY